MAEGTRGSGCSRWFLPQEGPCPEAELDPASPGPQPPWRAMPSPGLGVPPRGLSPTQAWGGCCGVGVGAPQGTPGVGEGRGAGERRWHLAWEMLKDGGSRWGGIWGWKWRDRDGATGPRVLRASRGTGWGLSR